MDEATTFLDPLTEARLLSECNARKVTIVGVCHRESAVGFHRRVLRYTAPLIGDPRSWEIQNVDPRDVAAAEAATAQANAEWTRRQQRKQRHAQRLHHCRTIHFGFQLGP